VPFTLPGKAASSESDATQPVAKAWFNSGWANPSKGPNSFTLKAENGVSQATLWYKIGDSQPVTTDVFDSGNEISFSVAPSPTTHSRIVYRVCGIYRGHRVCAENEEHDFLR
jgi:hypothetical protein